MKLRVILLSSVIALSSAALMAQEADIQARQKLFDEIKDEFKAIQDIMKSGNIDHAAVAGHAKAMKERFGQVGKHFTPGSDKGDTDAKPEIWKKMDKYKQRGQQAGAALDNLIKAAEKKQNEKALGAQIQNVGKSCKACHDDFRQPKEKSYKNKKGN